MDSLKETFYINNIKIPFSNDWKKIAVSLSGGADSALLTYILCDKIEKHNLDTEVHIISHIRCWKTKPWQKNDSVKVYEELKILFPNISFSRHVNFIAPELEWGSKGPNLIDEYGKQVSGDNIEIRGFSEYICHEYNIDAYFNAVTKNPENVDFKGMPTRDIVLTKDNQHLLLMKHMNKWACHPFRFTTKDQIIKLYYDLNLRNLLNLTRSCEGEFEDLNYKTYIPGQYVPLCKECFWCKEREWAIEQNK